MAGARPILSWLADPAPDHGIRMADATAEHWHFTSYRELAVEVRRTAGYLRASGVEPGAVLPVVRPNSVAFVTDVFGALAAGVTPAPVAPPKVFRDEAAYLSHLARVVRMTGARQIATTPTLASRFRSVADELGCRLLTGADPDGAVPAGALTPPATALVQLSSGSTGPHKGFQLSTPALEWHAGAIIGWLGVTPDDGIATWSPTHHDMGLVGCVLSAVLAGCDIWLMEPEQYVRWPLRWLRRFSAPHVTIAATTSAALAYLVKRVRPADLAGTDFSGWRSMIVGAERVDARVLDEVVALLAPHGFRREALRPAYGLAEATLAVTGVPDGSAPRTVSVDMSTLRPGDKVPVGTAGTRLVGCGRPLAGVEVSIVDDDGVACAEDTLGEIEVRSRSLASGYLTDDGAGQVGDRLRTGDAGFRHDGDLFVVGRIGDSVKQLGTWLFAEDFDQIAAAASPWPQRTVALLGNLAGRDTVVVVVEGRLGPAADRIGQVVRRHAADLRVVVGSFPAGTVKRTTSGKPMRRAMWRALVAGWDDEAVQWDSDRGSGGPDRPVR
jgi:acyl-CoA synthetase (AMP-forming)/AMP-acid ligase II